MAGRWSCAATGDEAIACVEAAVLARGVRPGQLTLGADNGSQFTSRDLYGRAVIAPAAAVTLLTGLVLVVQEDFAFSDLWARHPAVEVLVHWGDAAGVASSRTMPG